MSQPLGLAPSRTFFAWVVDAADLLPADLAGLTAFKTEGQAISVPPQLSSRPRSTASSRSDAQRLPVHSTNSLITSVVSTLLGLADRRARRLLDGVLPHQARATS